MVNDNERGIMLTSMTLTPAERTLRAKIAAHTRWANADPEARRQQGNRLRAAAERRFEDQVDPERVLSPADRAQRADAARKAHMSRMALASSKARRKKKGSK